MSSMVIIITIMLQRITFYYKEKYIESTQKNETIKVVKLKRIYRICRFGSVMCGVSIIYLSYCCGFIVVGLLTFLLVLE